MFLEADWVVLRATGFVWLAWPEARNELGPLSGQTPGMAPTFLWPSCPPAVGPDASVELLCCPVPLSAFHSNGRQSSHFWANAESSG